MRISCEVIKDLLPLYIDDVCSDESRKMIVEHLAECEECKSELAAMQSELPVDIHKQDMRDAQAVKNLSKKWRKSLLKSLLKGVVTTLIIVAVIAFILIFIADMRIL